MTMRSTLLNAVLYGGLLGCSFQTTAQTVDEPFVVGVCAHELHKGDPSGRAYAMMRDAGITSVRTDAHWAYVERQPNQLKIEPSWQRYLKETARHGLSTQFILGYGNQHHGGGEKPRSEPVRAAYNRYVDFVTENLKGQVAYYEIWNEWDVEDPRDPTFTQDYARLIADAAGIIRQRDPAATVLAGAVTSQGIESGFALRLLENGLMQSVDGLSLHPYVHCRGWRRNTPEAWIDWMAEVDKELTRAAGRPVPLYLTEMAWPSHQGACGIDETLQAAYLARAFFLARTLPNIKGMWWYDFRNDGTDKAEREHNFGLVRQDFTPKPAYPVLAAISEIVSRYAFLGRLENTANDVVMLRFARGEDELLVAWSTGKPRTVELRGNENNEGITGRVAMIDTAQPRHGRVTTGNEWRCPASDDACSTTVTLDGFPKIISLRAIATEG
jgi:polysaccharide biosynthesis protein PslG